MDMRKIKAIEQSNKERILKICPDANNKAGVYFLVREEDGFKYCYVGQSLHVLSRLAQHLSGYQHIDLSLKRHKLWSEENPTGWKVGTMNCEFSKLDELEKKYIKMYANKGYQMRNKTLGGQGEGKKGIAENKTSKGYYDGLEQGYKKAQKYIANLFDKHLDYRKKSDKPNKNQDKALSRFEDFIKVSDEKS